ncbi:MAG TPA: NAD-dependent epimerase/dehydratase family protein [Solirubrobacteraceae bacterium]|nr:NAD-dependent epimerase/dehydratase family protein [Solirubrobacteraceae bacterium]
MTGASAPGSARGDRCLVTGASGFIGGHLAERLSRDGREVRGLVRASSDTSRLTARGIELAVGDLGDRDSLARAAEGCRYVLHCGAMVSDWGTVKEIRRINATGTRDLLDAACAASVERFIHFSSTDVYGYPGQPGVDETYVPQGFANWYAQTKWEAEAEVRRAQVSGALACVTLRPATVYGPGSKEVVGEMARALRGRHMLLIDHGRTVAGLTYVENLIDAAVLALERERAPGQAFNITDGLPVTWRQFLDDLADGLGCPRARWSVPFGMAKGLGFSLEQGYRGLRRATRLTLPPLLSRQAVGVLGREQDFSNAKARQWLGWEPRVDYPSGLAATLAWLRAELS